MAKRSEAEAYAASLSVARRMAKQGIITPEELAKAEILLKQSHGVDEKSALCRMLLIQSPERACICVGGKDHDEDDEGAGDAG